MAGWMSVCRAAYAVPCLIALLDVLLLLLPVLTLRLCVVGHRYPRARRPGEVEGRDYFFVDRERFEEWIATDMLLEHALVYGEYKGIPRQQVGWECAGWGPWCVGWKTLAVRGRGRSKSRGLAAGWPLRCCTGAGGGPALVVTGRGVLAVPGCTRWPTQRPLADRRQCTLLALSALCRWTRPWLRGRTWCCALTCRWGRRWGRR